MSGRDTWQGETPKERARRLMRMNDYLNAVTACDMAFAKLEKLAGKAKKPKTAKQQEEAKNTNINGNNFPVRYKPTSHRQPRQRQL